MQRCDVGAALAAGEGDFRGFSIDFFTSGSARGGVGDDGEDAASVGGEFSIGGLLGAAVENVHALHGTKAGDEIHTAGGHGIARGGEDEADAPVGGELDEVGAQFAASSVVAVIGEVATEQRHDGFAFGIAEAAVVFDHLRSLRCQHEAKI